MCQRFMNDNKCVGLLAAAFSMPSIWPQAIKMIKGLEDEKYNSVMNLFSCYLSSLYEISHAGKNATKWIMDHILNIQSANIQFFFAVSKLGTQSEN